MRKALGNGHIPTSHSVSVCLYTSGPQRKQALEQAFSGSTEAGARGRAPKDQQEWLPPCIVGEPLSFEGSVQVSWSTSSHLTHGLAFHPPGQEPFTFTVNLTSYPTTAPVCLCWGFHFPSYMISPHISGRFMFSFLFPSFNSLPGKLVSREPLLVFARPRSSMLQVDGQGFCLRISRDSSLPSHHSKLGTPVSQPTAEFFTNTSALLPCAKFLRTVHQNVTAESHTFPTLLS